VGTVLDLEPVRVASPRRKRYKLAELMSGYKPEHRHGEWKPSRPVGREIW
jgi:antitoxin component of MazEF toxin-antitoxin module